MYETNNYIKIIDPENKHFNEIARIHHKGVKNRENQYYIIFVSGKGCFSLWLNEFQMELSENPYNVDYNNEQYKLGLADGYNKAKDEYYEKMKSVEMQIEFRKQNSINESYNKGFYDGDNYGMSHSHPDLRPENREHKMGM